MRMLRMGTSRDLVPLGNGNVGFLGKEMTWYNESVDLQEEDDREL